MRQEFCQRNRVYTHIAISTGGHYCAFPAAVHGSACLEWVLASYRISRGLGLELFDLRERERKRVGMFYWFNEFFTERRACRLWIARLAVWAVLQGWVYSTAGESIQTRWMKKVGSERGCWLVVVTAVTSQTDCSHFFCSSSSFWWLKFRGE